MQPPSGRCQGRFQAIKGSWLPGPEGTPSLQNGPCQPQPAWDTAGPCPIATGQATLFQAVPTWTLPAAFFIPTLLLPSASPFFGCFGLGWVWGGRKGTGCGALTEEHGDISISRKKFLLGQVSEAAISEMRYGVGLVPHSGKGGSG